MAVVLEEEPFEVNPGTDFVEVAKYLVWVVGVAKELVLAAVVARLQEFGVGKAVAVAKLELEIVAVVVGTKEIELVKV